MHKISMGEIKINKSKNISKIIKRRYIPAVILLIVIIIIGQLIIQHALNPEEHLSRVVNIAGKQRMLSQKIAKDAYGIYISENRDSINLYFNELKTSTDTWEKSIVDLKMENRNEGLEVHNSEKTMQFFSEIEGNHQEIVNAAYDIISMIESKNYSRSSLLKKIKVIENNEELFLKGMDNIVIQYGMEYKDRITFLAKIEMCLFIIVVIIILFEIKYIFIPAEKSLSNSFEDIQESYENMMKLFKTSDEIMFIIDEETFDVMLMNKEAEKFVQIDYSDNKSINIRDIIQCETDGCSKVLKNIKTNTKNENMEVVISLNEKKNITALISTIKINFNKKTAILIGLFDITTQKEEEEALKKLAVTDKLTGLYNRHFLDKSINEEMERADLNNKPISMIILDLDHFKNINDTWGHPIGDEVLKQASEIISNIIRKSDILFRLGGEEFLLLMTQTTANDAVIVAEKIRNKLEKNIHPTVGKFTASLGVAEKMKSESFNSWYKRVDEALYCAKEGGRNRVVNAESKKDFPIALVHFEWKHQWESGNKEIDEQHKELLEIANTLIYSSLSSEGSEKTMYHLDRLLKHIINHFDCEEQILHNIGYPDYEKHSKIHKILVEKTLRLKESYQKGEVTSSTFFSFIIDDVVIGHMLKSDVKFFSYTQNRDIIV